MKKPCRRTMHPPHLSPKRWPRLSRPMLWILIQRNFALPGGGARITVRKADLWRAHAGDRRQPHIRILSEIFRRHLAAPKAAGVRARSPAVLPPNKRAAAPYLAYDG